MKLEGVYSVLPTPFAENGDVDEASLRRVVDLFIDAGVNGVTALGVTGEVARLDEGERARVLEIVVDQVEGRIGVVAGTTADGTRTCIELQPPGEGGRRDRRHGQPAADAEAQLRGGRAPLQRARRRGGHRDRRPGLSADLRLRDGAGAAGAHRAGRSRARGRSSSRIRRRRSRRRGSSSRPATSRCGSSAVSAACSCSKS